MERIKVIVIGSGRNTERFCFENENNSYIDIIGTIPCGGLNGDDCTRYAYL